MCRQEIVGVGVVMADELATDEEKPYLVYQGEREGEPKEYALLHPVCFLDLFNEIIRQQGEAAMFVAISVAGGIREALSIRD